MRCDEQLTQLQGVPSLQVLSLTFGCMATSCDVSLQQLSIGRALAAPMSMWV